MDFGPPPGKRLKLTRKELEDLSKEELVENWLQQEHYVEAMESRSSNGQKDNLELAILRESEEKLRQQQQEATRRENLLVMRLAAKEQEMQECATQIQELKQVQNPGSTQLRCTMLDPAVNLMLERMKKELQATKAKLEETQNELSAWKFTPDSNTGKRLMAKCRLLYQENEELGKMISSGRMAKLEGDLALQKTFSEEMKKSQGEVDEFLMELDEDVEGMQTTILYLQHELRDAKDAIAKLQSELELLSFSSRAPHASTTEPGATIPGSPKLSVPDLVSRETSAVVSYTPTSTPSHTPPATPPPLHNGNHCHSPRTKVVLEQPPLLVPPATSSNIVHESQRMVVDSSHSNLSSPSPSSPDLAVGIGKGRLQIQTTKGDGDNVEHENSRDSLILILEEERSPTPILSTDQENEVKVQRSSPYQGQTAVDTVITDSGDGRDRLRTPTTNRLGVDNSDGCGSPLQSLPLPNLIEIPETYSPRNVREELPDNGCPAETIDDRDSWTPPIPPDVDLKKPVVSTDCLSESPITSETSGVTVPNGTSSDGLSLMSGDEGTCM